jgi:hypothetical protein
LEAIETRTDAMLLLKEAVPMGTPGREYYANLGTFLMNGYAVPAKATYVECVLYFRFVRRLDADGSLPAGRGPTLFEQREKAIRERNPARPGT